MPVRVPAHPLNFDSDCPPFFRSLTDLDKWVSRPSNAQSKLSGVLDYVPRGSVQGLASDESGGRLLVGFRSIHLSYLLTSILFYVKVCHDYKVMHIIIEVTSCTEISLRF